MIIPVSNVFNVFVFEYNSSLTNAYLRMIGIILVSGLNRLPQMNQFRSPPPPPPPGCTTMEHFTLTILTRGVLCPFGYFVSLFSLDFQKVIVPVPKEREMPLLLTSIILITENNINRFHFHCPLTAHVILLSKIANCIPVQSSVLIHL